jgi:DNA mismatch endonuclease Vsr
VQATKLESKSKLKAKASPHFAFCTPDFQGAWLKPLVAALQRCAQPWLKLRFAQIRAIRVSPPSRLCVKIPAVRDRLTKARRSWNMSRIRGKHTTPEKVVRSALHRMGFRFRLHGKGLPGRPDIVSRKYKTVVFVHGCFWHRHKGCRNCTTPTNRREWWLEKLNGNAAGLNNK